MPISSLPARSTRGHVSAERGLSAAAEAPGVCGSTRAINLAAPVSVFAHAGLAGKSVFPISRRVLEVRLLLKGMAPRGGQGTCPTGVGSPASGPPKKVACAFRTLDLCYPPSSPEGQRYSSAAPDIFISKIMTGPFDGSRNHHIHGLGDTIFSVKRSPFWEISARNADCRGKLQIYTDSVIVTMKQSMVTPL